MSFERKLGHADAHTFAGTSNQGSAAGTTNRHRWRKRRRARNHYWAQV